MKVWTSVHIRLPLSGVAACARRAEALGFDGICVPDAVHDGFLAAAAAVNATTGLQVATAALVAYARSPMIVAVAAWDLQAISGGRFELGLGPQVRGNIVRRYSERWTPPAPRMREYVHSLRAIFDCWQNGTPLEFEGEHYQFTRMQPFVKPRPLEHPDIPIVVAGIGPHMTAVAGEVADALTTHPTNVAPRYVREVIRPNLERGAARGGRSADEVALWINPFCATGVDEREARQSRERLRAALAKLYSTPSYWPTLELFGWKDLGETLNQLVREGRWEDMTGVITDEMLDTVVSTAPYGEIADVLRERYGELADVIAFPLPTDPSLDPEAARVIARLRE